MSASIRVSDETKQLLEALKRDGETFLDSPVIVDTLDGVPDVVEYVEHRGRPYLIGSICRSTDDRTVSSTQSRKNERASVTDRGASAVTVGFGASTQRGDGGKSPRPGTST